MKKFICGIDFGTSNTVVTIIDDSGEILEFFSIPTVIYFFQETFGVSKVLVGEDAIEYFLNHRTGRIINSIKSSLSDHLLRNTKINNKEMKLEEIVSLFLIEIKNRIDKTIGQKHYSVIAGHPVKFSSEEFKHDLALDRLKKAFDLAGFHDVVYLEEPVGAANSLLRRDDFELISQNNFSILLCDIGGGTSDFTLVSLKKDGLKVHAMDGVPIAGNRYDEALMKNIVASSLGKGSHYESFGKRLEVPVHYYNDIAKWQNLFYLDRVRMVREIKDFLPRSEFKNRIKLFLKLLEPHKNLQALIRAENAKIVLQEQQETEYSFDFLDHRHKIVITKELFDSKTASLTEKLLLTVQSMLSESQNEIQTIDYAFLTGGSSRLLEIQRGIAEILPETRIISDENRFSAISTGYAHYGLTQQ